MILIRSLKKTLYFLLLSLFLLTVASSIWKPQVLIAALPDRGFFDNTELLIPFLLLLPISFLLYDNYEIELSLVCGVKTVKLLFAKFFSVLAYGIGAMFAVVVLYRYAEYIPTQDAKIKIPIVIPENYRLYMFISVFVTVLFFASLFLFFRVVTKNCYAPVGLGLLIYTICNNFNYNIHNGFADIRKCIFDPFLSNYFLGDKVLTEYYKVGPLWTYNRLLFFGLAVGMLAITYVLLRREKLHQGFND